MELVRVNLNDPDAFSHAVHYVATRVNIPAQFLRPVDILQVEDGDERLGVVLFNNYRSLAPGKYTVQATFAADSSRAWTRSIIKDLFKTPFETGQCVRVEARCSAENHKVADYLERSGFTLEGRLQRGWDGEIDEMVYGMTKENCRWLGED